MPGSKSRKSAVAASALDIGILLNAPGVEGVDPGDASGTLPIDAPTNGLVVKVPRWPAFPGVPGVEHTVNIYIVGSAVSVARRAYSIVDDAAEFFIPVAALALPNRPSFEIIYIVRTPNPTTSPPRRLTFKVAEPPTVLKEPVFPDASLYGYIICRKNKPSDPESLFIWEGIRIFIPFDTRFQENDVVTLVWQGWATLNIAPPALTVPASFTVTVTAADIRDRNSLRIVIQPFVTWIKPMTANHSASATYTLLRRGAAIFKSRTGLVKLDRKIPGESGFCENSSWMK